MTVHGRLKVRINSFIQLSFLRDSRFLSVARLNMTLNTVQSKLQQLEEENGISRRRIRELEMELDICKRDVTRERTRVLEREEIIVQQQRDLKRNIKGKSKAPTRDISINVSGDRDIGHDLVRERYKEAVEEKKGLSWAFVLVIMANEPDNFSPGGSHYDPSFTFNSPHL